MLILRGDRGRHRDRRVPAARRVQMTAMPQLVALFNGVGGGAAALVALLELDRDVRLSAGERWRLPPVAFTVLDRLGVVLRLGRHVRASCRS